ncbi:MAG TPA: hypothetical protein VNG33_06900 [Polyangiaceae bacterium]|nr:hypothetical protein [Polyangiaceae bacterium]
MSTLPPLIESSSSERARQLLRAARADGPRSGAAGRAPAALGVAGTTATATSIASASAGAQLAASLGASAAASLPMIAAKWLVVGTLGGLALASGATLVFSKHEPERTPPQHQLALPRASAELPGVGPGPDRLEPGSTPADAAPEPAVSKPGKPNVSASASVSASAVTAPVPFTAPSQAAFESPEQSKLLRDVALLDDARRALKGGDTAQALALITRYDAERQTHVLDREALLLHVDVLTARGEHQRAKELAQRYLAAFPNDAHAERLRALVNDGK